MKSDHSASLGDREGGTRYAFGPFVLDPTRRLLWRDSQVVPLSARIFDVFWYLIQHRDRLVTKEELLEAIWGNTFVEEGTLIRQVSNLRKALNERPDQHNFVVTIPGRGYRFVARVDVMSGDEDEHHVNGHAPAVLPAASALPDVRPVPIAPPASPAFGLKALVWVGAAAAVAIVVLTAFLAMTQVGSPTEPQLTQVTFGPGLQHEPSWSPDGQAIAYSSDQLGTFDIWIQWLSETAPVRLTSSQSQDWQPDWSPDGKWIAFRSERDGGGLYVTSVHGGIERRIADFGHRPRWSPDGTRLLFSESARFSGESSRLYVVAWPNGTPELVRPDVLRDFSWVHAAWHPDGRQVAVYGRRSRENSELVSIPIEGGAPVVSPPSMAERLEAADLTFGRFVWSKSGREMFFEGRSGSVRNLWRVSVDSRTLAWLGAPERLTTGPGQDGNIAVSADGTKVAFAANTPQTRLWTFPFDPAVGKLKGAGEPITLGGDHDLGPDLPAATGDRLLYRTVRGQKRELRELSLADGRDQLVSFPSEVRFARVSPDGRRIAFVRTSLNGTRARPLVISSMGGGDEEQVPLDEMQFAPTDWSRDGDWLAGTCRPLEGRQLSACLIPVSNSPERPRVPKLVATKPQFNLYQERFSPDLKWLTFMAEPVAGAGVVGIYVVPISGTAAEWTPVVEDNAFNDKPRWAPNGRAIYYLSDRGGFMNLWGRRFDPTSGRLTGEPFRVTTFDSPRRMIPLDLISQVEVAIASDRLVLPLTESVGKVWVLDGLAK